MTGITLEDLAEIEKRCEKWRKRETPSEDDDICLICGQGMSMRLDDEPTTQCDHCAQEIAIHAIDDLPRLCAAYRKIVERIVAMHCEFAGQIVVPPDMVSTECTSALAAIGLRVTPNGNLEQIGEGR